MIVEDVLELIKSELETIADYIVCGLNIVQKKIEKADRNWESYTMGGIIQALTRSKYHKVYANLRGIYLPKLTDVPNTLMKSYGCEKCDVRNTCFYSEKTEIDALIIDENGNSCVIEHKSSPFICKDVLKIVRLLMKKEGELKKCVLVSWYAEKEYSEKEADKQFQLAKIVLDNLIGQDNWAIVYIPCSPEEGVIETPKLYHGK